MNRTSRRVVTGLLLAAGFSAVGLVGCSGSGGRDEQSAAVGEMALPLTTEGASGTTYRLRNATFVVQSQYYDYGYAGAAGSSGNPGTIVVSSETDPTARNISLSLEEGYYYVQLLPGWHMEKATAAGAQTVEATLLSGQTQWVYVSRQSTRYAEFDFGIGGREVWLNGKLNITINVQEGAGGDGPIGVAGSFGVGGESGSLGAGGFGGAE